MKSNIVKYLLLYSVILLSCNKLTEDLKRGCFIPYIDFVVFNVNPNTLEVDIKDITTNNGSINAYKWEMGDGTIYSLQKPPIHKYPPLTSNAPTKTYRVTYTATNECGSAFWSKNIAVGPCLADVRFTFSSINDSTIQISNQSSSKTPVSYLWNFGDGSSMTNNSLSFQKTYRREGTFNIVLTATNSCGENSYTIPVIICKSIILKTPLVSITTGNKVRFDASNSENITSYRWNFGNGVTTATNSSPIVEYTYPAIGSYNTILTVSNACTTRQISTRVDISCLGIDTIPIVIPTNYDDLSCTFSSSSVVNATSYRWEFGDGTTSTNRTFGTKQYAAPGNYSVKFVVANNCSTKEQIINVSLPHQIIPSGQITNGYRNIVSTNSLVFFLGNNGRLYQFNTTTNNLVDLGVTPIPFDANTRLIKASNNSVYIIGSNGFSQWTGTSWATTNSSVYGYPMNTVITALDVDNNNQIITVGNNQLRRGSAVLYNGTITSMKFNRFSNRVYFLSPALNPNRLLYFSTTSSVLNTVVVSNMSNNSFDLQLNNSDGSMYFISNQGIIRCTSLGNFTTYFNSGNVSFLTTTPNKIRIDASNNLWILLNTASGFFRFNVNNVNNKMDYSSLSLFSSIADFDIYEMNNADVDIFLAKSNTNGAIRIK